jgi:hypothetical protein
MTSIWQMPEFHHINNDFFQPQEKKQLQNAYENFILNTKSEENSDDELLLQSKIQLFQLFFRTQLINIRNSKYD